MALQKVAIIGAGPMGLACALALLKQGHAAEIFERDDRIGGMSASFDLHGLKVERFYHFICLTDLPYLNLLKELNISDKLKWAKTRMGFYYQGTLYPWSNPFHLLRFPHLSLWSKLRYSLNILHSKYVCKWDALDKLKAVVWLKQRIGAQAYVVLWENLLRLKYHHMLHEVSAAWIAARIRRVARSRLNIWSESLGYLEGGSDTLLTALQDEIIRLGGKIHVNAQVPHINTRHNKVVGIHVDGQDVAFDKVISTVPLPYVPKIAPTLPSEVLLQIAGIRNIGVVCVVFRLTQSVTNNFWLNINDPRMDIPGVIEYSNLCPLPDNVVYIPYYMPQDLPEYRQTDAEFIDKTMAYLTMINPDFSPEWVLAKHVSRYHYAQPLCTPGFLSTLPPMRSAIEGFFMADTAYYYPEDRSISESVQLGITLANLAMSPTHDA